MTATWTMVVAFATIGLALIAWVQLSKMSKITRADFVHRFKRDFFNQDTRRLFDLFEDDQIVFIQEEGVNETDRVLFELDPSRTKHGVVRSVDHDKVTYSCSEIDDFLLGHFEDMGLFCRQGLMDIESIYEGFDYYIELVHDNEQIQEYIKWNRSAPGGEDIYDGFDYIYSEVKKYGETKRRKRRHIRGYDR
ncbi:MAG: hypothetical protein HQL08_08630 [Nitrospirae bacterium]|nr:hypothetical protein [Nitrospirota bacterium]